MGTVQEKQGKGARGVKSTVLPQIRPGSQGEDKQAIRRYQPGTTPPTFTSGPTCQGDLQLPPWVPGGHPHLRGCWAGRQPREEQHQMQTSGCSLDDEIKRGSRGEARGKGQKRRWR